jgi:hypothetical protein
MTKTIKYALIFAVSINMSATFVACSDDDDNKKGNNNESTIVLDAKYKEKKHGQSAIDACTEVVKQFEAANTTIQQSNLTNEQEAYLRNVLTNLVKNVIVPTYTKLADDVEDLEKTLNGLTVNSITQDQINRACKDFKDARENWERSEAFLMGAASDFDIDPTID